MILHAMPVLPLPTCIPFRAFIDQTQNKGPQPLPAAPPEWRGASLTDLSSQFLVVFDPNLASLVIPLIQPTSWTVQTYVVFSLMSSST